MKSKLLLLIVLAILALPTAFAGPTESLSYEQLVERSDLIVIATPAADGDTKIVTAEPDNNHSSSALSVKADLDILAVLKGSKEENTIALHYFVSPGPSKARINPAVYGPKKTIRYLMFLTRDLNGDYLPVTGKMNPDGSIKDLGSPPP